MLIRVGLELNNDGRAIAWALDFPGCFAYGPEGPDAVIALAPALAEYEVWANRHGGSGWLSLGDYDLRLVETWTDYTIDEQYELSEEGYAVKSFFRHDWKPIRADEVQRAQSLLGWARADLLQIVTDLSEEQLDRQVAGERWSIRGILKHIANAEWWYLDRLDLANAPRDRLPADALERLHFVRERLVSIMPSLVDRELVTGREGELWSPRKLLRRAAWHERDHIQHIAKLL